LNKPIEHDTATVSYNLELPINQADEDGESNDELPEEMARLLEQESKEIQPNQEPIEAWVRTFHTFNDAFLAKQGWRILTNLDSLLARTYKAKYFPNCHFLHINPGQGSSYTWCSIR
jgi:hypothetical protein